MPFEEMKDWYDGYTVGGISVYNPNSVLVAFLERRFDNYWTQTTTYQHIREYITQNFDGLREKVVALLEGKKVEMSMSSYRYSLADFDSTDCILAILVHLGYLTYESKDPFYQDIGYVSIPNREVRRPFELSVAYEPGYQTLFRALRKSEQLLDATLRMDEEAVAAGIEKAHEKFTSIIKANDENSLACVISNAYYSAIRKYSIYNEFPSGKGYADMVFVPRKDTSDPPIVVELKYMQDAETAIDQIKSHNYHGRLLEEYEEVILVGINYDKEDRVKPYTCKIEKWKM